MWTYMMAASRGERANTMLPIRRRTETESPKYGYNLSRPMYRTKRFSASPSMATTSVCGSYPYTNSHYLSNNAGASSTASSSLHTSSGSQMFHTNAAAQQRLPLGTGAGDDNVACAASSGVGGNDDGTSLFSPLTPSTTMTVDKDVNIFNFRDSTGRRVRKHLIANHVGEMLENTGTGSAVVRMPSLSHDSDSDDDYNDNNDNGAGISGGGARYMRGSRRGHALRKRNEQRTVVNNDDDGDDDDDDDDDDSGSSNVQQDEDDEVELDFIECTMESGNKLTKDQMNRSKPSALRRTLNALRQRLTKRNRSKPPDWFLEKFTTNINHSSANTNNINNNDRISSATTTAAGKTNSTMAAVAATSTTTTTTAATTRTRPTGNNQTTATTTNTTNAAEIHGTSRLCNRLSVDPTLQSHYRWLGVVSLAVFYNIIFVVGRSVFWEINQRATPIWYFLDYLCDFIYLVDTLVHMHEGYLDQGLLVRDACKLRRHYFGTKIWTIDALSMLPTDLAYIWWSPKSCNATFLPCAVIVRLNRLLRLPRMWEWFDRTETATSYPNAFRICKVVLAILVLIHWNACLYFAISYALGFGSDNWVYNLNGYRNSTLQRQYIYSFYWSTLTLTTIGETPIPENDPEYLFVVADFLAGVLIFATIVGNIGSMISNMNVARVEFQNRMDGVKQYMAFRKVGHELEARVIRWFAYTWSQSGALDEERVLAALPDKLKAEIAIQVHMDTLKQVRIFHDCEPGLLEALVLKLKLQVFSPGDYICRKGDVGKEMYIVKRGKLSVVADDGVTVFATLGAGSVFGEVSVLEIAGNRTGNRRTANVRSLGYSDLFCLAKRDLWETLADYPEARATLTERGCQLLRKDGLLDEQVFADSQRVPDSIESGVEKLEFSVENLNVRLARLLAEYTASQAKLKQRLAKLELNYQLTHASTTAMSTEYQIRPRSGRLYSLQPKKRPRKRMITASKSIDSKQNTL